MLTVNNKKPVSMNKRALEDRTTKALFPVGF